jgi:hypothetical protein
VRFAYNKYSILSENYITNLTYFFMAGPIAKSKKKMRRGQDQNEDEG